MKGWERGSTQVLSISYIFLQALLVTGDKKKPHKCEASCEFLQKCLDKALGFRLRSAQASPSFICPLPGVRHPSLTVTSVLPDLCLMAACWISFLDATVSQRFHVFILFCVNNKTVALLVFIRWLYNERPRPEGRSVQSSCNFALRRCGWA